MAGGQVVLLVVTHAAAFACGAFIVYLRDHVHCDHCHHVEDARDTNGTD